MERQTKINFDATTHTYTDDNGNVFTSVTTLIGKYKPPFDKKYWSMYVALRDTGFKVRPTNNKKHIYVDGVKRSIEDLYRQPINTDKVAKVVNHWKHLTEVACDRGNKVHDFLEDSINISKDDITGDTNKLITPSISLQGTLLILKTKHDLDKTDVKQNYPTIYKRLLKYIENGWTLFAEKRVCTTTYQVAGTIDVLAVKGKYFAILDWKTNKDELKFSAGYYKKRWINGHYIKTDEWIPKEQYLYAPLDNIQNCKGMLYTLQLNTYAYIMIRWGYKLANNGLEIFHIRPHRVPKLIKVPIMQEPIDRMMKHHLKYRVNTGKHTGTIFGIT